jgi:hypothetical protein
MFPSPFWTFSPVLRLSKESSNPQIQGKTERVQELLYALGMGKSVIYIRF